MKGNEDRVVRHALYAVSLLSKRAGRVTEPQTVSARYDENTTGTLPHPDDVRRGVPLDNPYSTKTRYTPIERATQNMKSSSPRTIMSTSARKIS